jgi:hypothetical protein
MVCTGTEYWHLSSKYIKQSENNLKLSDNLKELPTFFLGCEKTE